MNFPPLDRARFFQYVLMFCYLLLFLPFWKQVLLGFLFACACAPMLSSIRVTLKARKNNLVVATIVLTILSFVAVLAYLGIKTVGFAYQLAENQDLLSQLGDKAAL